MKLRKLRDGDVLGNSEMVLVRGGDLDPDVLRADAARYHSVYAAITPSASITWTTA